MAFVAKAHGWCCFDHVCVRNSTRFGLENKDAPASDCRVHFLNVQISAFVLVSVCKDYVDWCVKNALRKNLLHISFSEKNRGGGVNDLRVGIERSPTPFNFFFTCRCNPVAVGRWLC